MASWRRWVSSRIRSQPIIELALETGDNFGRSLVRRMGGSGREIDEEGLVGRGGLLVVDPADNVVGEALIDHFAAALVSIDPAGAAIEDRGELVGIALRKAEEYSKPRPVGQLLNGPASLAGFRAHRVFAEHCGAVAISWQ